MRSLALSLLAASGACSGALAGAGVTIVSPRTVERPEYGTCLEAGGKVELPNVGFVTQLSSTCFRSAQADGGTRVPALMPDLATPETIFAKDGGL